MISNPLIPGAVYQTVQGPMTFKGLDYYKGSETYKFEPPNGFPRYISYETIQSFLLPIGADK